MADDDEGGQVDTDLDTVWIIPGLIIGLPLAAHVASRVVDSSNNDSAVVILFVFGMGAAPAIILTCLAQSFHREIARGKMSWEEYWMILSGMTVAAFFFLGITGVDDFTSAYDYLMSLDSL